MRFYMVGSDNGVTTRNENEVKTMHANTLLWMIAGFIPTPKHLEPTIEQLRPLFSENYFRNLFPESYFRLFADNQADAPAIAEWEAWHESGKRCGHIHRDQAKARACAVRLGAGWAVAESRRNVAGPSGG